jgi:hypothetical protein
MGDIDNDGDHDLFITDFQFNKSSSIYIQNSEGLFKKKDILNLAPQSILSSHFVDIDRDGDLDLVLGTSGLNQPQRSNYLYLNDGKGHLEKTNLLPPKKLDPHWDTIQIESRDLDLNGYPDLIFISHNRNITKGAIQIIFNKDGKEFIESTDHLNYFQIPNNFWIPSIHFGDFNGDRRLDIIVPLRMPHKPTNSIHTANLFKILVSKGIHSYRDITNSIELNNKWFASIFFTDLDNDKISEILFFDYDGNYYVLRNKNNFLNQLYFKWLM